MSTNKNPLARIMPLADLKPRFDPTPHPPLFDSFCALRDANNKMSWMLCSLFSLFLASVSLILCFSLGQAPNEFELANAVITFGLTLRKYIEERIRKSQV